MEHQQKDELTRIRELLQHTSEFIAYFELAETKMHAWRQEIEQQGAHLLQQQELLKTLTSDSLTRIDKQSEHAIALISKQLSRYDPQKFHRIANESCEQVKQAAHEAVHKSNKLLRMFQLRFNLFTVLTTILTAFIISLYLNGELPWEMHHQAKNERQAGKVLLQAWPKLSQEEKTKILGYINSV